MGDQPVADDGGAAAVRFEPNYTRSKTAAIKALDPSRGKNTTSVYKPGRPAVDSQAAATAAPHFGTGSPARNNTAARAPVQTPQRCIRYSKEELLHWKEVLQDAPIPPLLEEGLRVMQAAFQPGLYAAFHFSRFSIDSLFCVWFVFSIGFYCATYCARSRCPCRPPRCSTCSEAQERTVEGSAGSCI
eukprot:m.868077 g.868077  ORF g.868077 m.868077 type:complete len:187 (+) comp59734_c1_seq5:40-600(+)